MSSPQWLILTAAKTLLEASSGLSGITWKIREKPFFSADHGDTAPLGTISPLKEQVGGPKYHMPAGIWLKWPVLVAIWTARGSTLQSATEIQTALARRWAVLQALGVPKLTSAPTVNDFEYDPDPLFDMGALDSALVVSLQKLTYLSAEIRGGAG